MGNHINQTSYQGIDNDKMNNDMKSKLNTYKKSMDSTGEDFKDAPKNKLGSGKEYDSTTSGNLMTFTTLLEFMDAVTDNLPSATSDMSNETFTDPNINNEDSENELLDQLNQIFTPILVMQNFENDVPSKIQEAMSEASILTEKNIIKFDDATRMSQLISVCALLLSKQKNSEKFQMYQKAATIRNQMKIEIQKEEYEAAKALAQKYLVKVSTTNNSSVARDAANNLLPETQH